MKSFALLVLLLALPLAGMAEDKQEEPDSVVAYVKASLGEAKLRTQGLLAEWSDLPESRNCMFVGEILGQAKEISRLLDNATLMGKDHEYAAVFLQAKPLSMFGYCIDIIEPNGNDIAPYNARAKVFEYAREYLEQIDKTLEQL